MTTHPETPAPTDPTDLAREVLAAEKVRDDTPGILYLDGPTHEHEEAAGAILDAAPALARAVIAVENVLQGWLITAAYVEARGWDISTVVEMAEDIRDALNGENA